jgi:hypothetical protein
MMSFGKISGEEGQYLSVDSIWMGNLEAEETEYMIYDGYAIATNVENGKKTRIEFPKLNELTKSQINKAMNYRFGSDWEAEGLKITPEDVMMSFGKIIGEAGIERPNRRMAQGGRVTTNDGIIESFLTSERELKVGNLSTHFNQYDNQMLLRNYGTLIATRKGNNVEITNVKYSRTTTIITNKVNTMALNKKMNVSYVNKFADGGETGENTRDNYDALIGRMDNEFYFLDDIFKYKDGFKGATGTIVMPVNSRNYEYATSEDGILERFMDAMGEDEWLEALQLNRDDFEDEDDLTKAIEDGIYQLYSYGELHPFEYADSDIESQMRELSEFADESKYPLFEVIGGGRIFGKDVVFDEIYNQELYDKIKQIEEFAKGGEAGDDDDVDNEKEYEDYWQDELNDLVMDFNESEYIAFCYEHDIEIDDAQEMSDFIYSQTDNRAKEIIQEIQDGYYSDGVDEDEYAGGGSVKGIKKKAEKLLENSITYVWRDTDMGSGWKFSLENPKGGVIENDLLLDSFDGDDLGLDEDWDSAFPYGVNPERLTCLEIVKKINEIKVDDLSEEEKKLILSKLTTEQIRELLDLA